MVNAQLFTGPVSSGMGGAGVASVEVVESSFLNPATLAHSPQFVGGLFFQEGWLEGLHRQSQLALTLVDYSEGVLIPGSFGFVQNTTSYEDLGSVNKRIWHIAVGDFVINQLAVGTSLHYVEAELAGQVYDQFNMTAGALWNPHPDWGFGLSFYNLFAPSTKTPLMFRDIQSITIGFTFIASEFLRLRGDIGQRLQENPDRNLQIRGGIESFIARFFVLRLGWNSNQWLKRDNLTAGFSFLSPRFTLDYAYQKSQEREERGALHSVDLSLPF